MIKIYIFDIATCTINAIRTVILFYILLCYVRTSLRTNLSERDILLYTATSAKVNSISPTDRDLKLSDIFSVTQLDIVLINHSILHCGVDFAMTKQFLHLFNGHSLVYCSCGKSTPEFVRVNLCNAEFPS